MHSKIISCFFISFVLLFSTACPEPTVDPPVIPPDEDPIPPAPSSSFSWVEMFSSVDVMDPPAGMPAAPSDLMVIPYRDSALIAWNDNSKNKEAMHIYTGHPGARMANITVSSSSETYTTMKGLKPDTTYQVWAEAVNSSGKSASVSTVFKTASDQAPADFPNAELDWSHKNGQFEVKWEPVSGAEEYWVLLDYTHAYSSFYENRLYILEKTKELSISLDLSSCPVYVYTDIYVVPKNSYGFGQPGVTSFYHPVHPDRFDSEDDMDISKFELTPTTELQFSEDMTLGARVFNKKENIDYDDYADSCTLNLESGAKYRISLEGELPHWYNLDLFNAAGQSIADSNGPDLMFTAPATGKFRLTVSGGAMKYRISYQQTDVISDVQYLDTDLIEVTPVGIQYSIQPVAGASKYRLYLLDGEFGSVEQSKDFIESSTASILVPENRLKHHQENYFSPAYIDASGNLFLFGAPNTVSCYFAPADPAEPDDQSADAQRFTPNPGGTLFRQSLHTNSREDWFVFAGAAGDVLQVKLDKLNFAGDLTVGLYDKDINLVYTHDIQSLDGWFQSTLNVSGDFFLRISSAGINRAVIGYDIHLKLLTGSILASPANFTTTCEPTGLTLSWDAVAGAEKYIIYRKIQGEYMDLGKTASTTFTDDQIPLMESGFYRVCAMNTSGEEGASSQEKRFIYHAFKPETLTTISPTASPRNAEITLSADTLSYAVNIQLKAGITVRLSASSYTSTKAMLVTSSNEVIFANQDINMPLLYTSQADETLQLIFSNHFQDTFMLHYQNQ